MTATTETGAEAKAAALAAIFEGVDGWTVEVEVEDREGARYSDGSIMLPATRTVSVRAHGAHLDGVFATWTSTLEGRKSTRFGFGMRYYGATTKTRLTASNVFFYARMAARP